MGLIMRNGKLYRVGGGGDDAFRYVNDPNDENYGWIQYQDADGNWVNYEPAFTKKYVLFEPNNNAANFVAYAGGIDSTAKLAPTVTFGDVMAIVQAHSGSTSGSDSKMGCVITENSIDLTEYDTIKLEYTDTGSKQALSDVYAKLIITSAKATNMTATASQYIFQNSLLTSGEVELDISAIDGEYYVAILLHSFGMNDYGYARVNVNNMYME